MVKRNLVAVFFGCLPGSFSSMFEAEHGKTTSYEPTTNRQLIFRKAIIIASRLLERAIAIFMPCHCLDQSCVWRCSMYDYIMILFYTRYYFYYLIDIIMCRLMGFVIEDSKIVL